jgi:hypothetical protein
LERQPPPRRFSNITRFEGAPTERFSAAGIFLRAGGMTAIRAALKHVRHTPRRVPYQEHQRA